MDRQPERKPKKYRLKEESDDKKDKEVPQRNKEDFKEKKAPRKKLSDCNLDALFFAVRKLTEEEAKDIEEAVHQIKYPKARKYLEEFFDTEQKYEETIKICHIVLKKIMEQEWRFHSLFRCYLVLLKKKMLLVRKLCNMEEILKLEGQVHQNNYPYFCELFQIKIEPQKAKELLAFYAKKQKYQAGFKLIQITQRSKAQVDVLLSIIQKLIQGAYQDKYQEIAGELSKLKFTKYDYPEIHEKLLTDSLFYFYREEGYEHVEEIFRPHPKILATIVGKMLSKHENKYDEAKGICQRNREVIKYLKYPERMESDLRKRKRIADNKLLTDKFAPSSRQQFWSFSDFGFELNRDVFFIEKDFPKIDFILEQISTSDMIGIDTESHVARSKLDSEEDLVATLQIATKKGAYVFEPHKIKNQHHIVKCFQRFFMDQSKKVVGHTVQDDFHLVLHCLGITETKCQVIELKDMFQQIYPQQRKNLANMCDQVLGKPLCKEYTLTDWGRRPLLLNQLHYAAMDAFIVLILFEKMDKKLKEKGEG